MTNARSRMVFGSTTYNPPSVFIAEAPPHLLEQSGSSFQRRMGTPSVESKKTLQQKSANRGFSGVKAQAITPNTGYAVGDGVVHKAFGQGVVLSVKPMGNDMLLEIAFEKAGTKKIMAKFAKLEKL